MSWFRLDRGCDDKPWDNTELLFERISFGESKLLFDLDKDDDDDDEAWLLSTFNVFLLEFLIVVSFDESDSWVVNELKRCGTWRLRRFNDWDWTGVCACRCVEFSIQLKLV